MMSSIYNDIAAQLYDLWFGQEPFVDQAFYQYYIEQIPGLALEIGSGTGRLLLPYLRDGLQVEGIEPSEAMIEQCKNKAQKMGLEPLMYQQAMEQLDLEKKYATIYIPMCAFQLLIDRNVAQQTLKRFYNHLVEGGQLLISLYIPWDDPSGSLQNVWRLRRRAQRDDKTEVVLSEAIRIDRFEQRETQLLKYEFFKNGSLDKTEFKTMEMRWYYRFEFAMMLEQAGFQIEAVYDDYAHHAANENTQTCVWRAIKK